MLWYIYVMIPAGFRPRLTTVSNTRSHGDIHPLPRRYEFCQLRPVASFPRIAPAWRIAYRAYPPSFRLSACAEPLSRCSFYWETDALGSPSASIWVKPEVSMRWPADGVMVADRSSGIRPLVAPGNPSFLRLLASRWVFTFDTVSFFFLILILEAFHITYRWFGSLPTVMCSRVSVSMASGCEDMWLWTKAPQSLQITKSKAVPVGGKVKGSPSHNLHQIPFPRRVFQSRP